MFREQCFVTHETLKLIPKPNNKRLPDQATFQCYWNLKRESSIEFFLDFLKEREHEYSRLP